MATGNSKRNTVIIVLKVINIVTSLALIGLSTISFIFASIQMLTSLKIFLVLSPLFMIAFGIAMLAAQLNVKFIVAKISFIKSLAGRGLFYLYLSSIVFYYFFVLDMELVAWMSAICLFVAGIVYICMHFGCANDLNSSSVLSQNANDDDEPAYNKESLM